MRVVKLTEYTAVLGYMYTRRRRFTHKVAMALHNTRVSAGAAPWAC